MESFLLNLLATNHQLDFNAPPPPDLRYKYPPATADIIRNIGRHLLNNPAFYTQVLNFMNRMHLPPPFHDNPCSTSTATQTDKVQWLTRPGLATDESELSSEDEEIAVKKRKISIDRKPSEDKRKFRAILKLEKELRSKPPKKSPEIPKKIQESTIKLNIPDQLSIKKSLEIIQKEDIPCPKSSSITKEEIAKNRIPMEELRSNNPVFQKYDSGTPSNVLYIKNLSKTISKADLEQIYGLYSDDLSVDLKATGRLRGQAFIRFDAGNIDEALQETNGCVLKDKPMYVCYSKSSSKDAKNETKAE